MVYFTQFHSITWLTLLEITLPGFFTLIGAGLGAFLGGKYAINAVNNQLNYESNNKRLDNLDNYLKINERFSTLLRLTLKHINKFQNDFLLDTKEKDYIAQNDLINNLEKLNKYIEKNYKEMSVLPIHNVEYSDYMLYRGLLYDMKSMNAIPEIILRLKKLSDTNKLTENPSEEIERYYIKFIEQKNILEGTKELIYEQHNISKLHLDNLNDEIKKITTNKRKNK